MSELSNLQRAWRLAFGTLLLALAIVDMFYPQSGVRAYLVIATAAIGVVLLASVFRSWLHGRSGLPSRGSETADASMAPGDDDADVGEQQTNLNSMLSFTIRGPNGDADFRKEVTFIPLKDMRSIEETLLSTEPDEHDRFMLELEEVGRSPSSGTTRLGFVQDPRPRHGKRKRKDGSEENFLDWPLSEPLRQTDHRRFKKTIVGTLSGAFSYEDGPEEFINVRLYPASSLVLSVTFDAEYRQTMEGDPQVLFTLGSWGDREYQEELECERTVDEAGALVLRAPIEPCPGDSKLRISWRRRSPG